MNHRAETRIVGEVAAPMRFHSYAGGVVANFVVEVTFRGHTETYRCVCFSELGKVVEQTIVQGQIVTVVGYMKTSPWRDDPEKQNHQLICDSFKVEQQAAPAPQPKRKRSKRNPRPRRQYGRHVRKENQGEIDFRHFAGEKQPEFNDKLPF